MKLLYKNIKSRLENTSIRFRVRLLVLIAILMPFLVVAVTLSILLVQAYHFDANRSIRNAADILDETISNQIDLVRMMSSTLFLDENVSNTLQRSTLDTSLEDVAQKKSRIQTLIATFEESEYIDSIVFYLEDGSSFIDHAHFLPLSSISDSDWYQTLQEEPTKNIWITPNLLNGDNTRSMSVVSSEVAYVSKAVNLSDYSILQSVVRINCSSSLLNEFMTNALPLPTSSAILATRNGDILANAAYEEPHDIDRDLIVRTKEGFQIIRTESGKLRIYRKNILPSAMTLLIITPNSVFSLRNAYHAVLIPIILLLFVWITVLVICLLFSNSITKRLQLISGRLRQTNNLHEIEPLPLFQGHDEITEIADSYNLLAQELKRNLEREYQLGIEKRSADLRALQAQINPHFLYNTLELINYYAYENQPRTVETIVSKLASFYRLSLNKGNDIYHLWQELDLVRSYFDIQNIRYRNRMKLLIDIPTELNQTIIPPITLQPIVENAIGHGIIQSPDKSGTITITARLDENGNVCIFIADDGMGLSKEEADKLNRTLHMDDDFFHSNAPKQAGDDAGTADIQDSSAVSSRTVLNGGGSYYGLRNIHARLRIMFGEGYGIMLYPGESGGAVVRVLLPI